MHTNYRVRPTTEYEGTNNSYLKYPAEARFKPSSQGAEHDVGAASTEPAEASEQSYDVVEA